MEKIVLKSSGIPPTARLHHGYNYEIVHFATEASRVAFHRFSVQSSELGFLDWRYGKKQSSTESKVFLNVVPGEIVENRVAV